MRERLRLAISDKQHTHIESRAGIAFTPYTHTQRREEEEEQEQKKKKRAINVIDKLSLSHCAGPTQTARNDDDGSSSSSYIYTPGLFFFLSLSGQQYIVKKGGDFFDPNPPTNPPFLLHTPTTFDARNNQFFRYLKMKRWAR